LQARLRAIASTSQVHRSCSAQPSLHLTERPSTDLLMLFPAGAVAVSMRSLCSDHEVVMQQPGAIQQPGVQTTQWYFGESTEPGRRQNLTMAPFSPMAPEVDVTMVRFVPDGGKSSVSEAELAAFGVTYRLPEVLCVHMAAGAQNFVAVDLWSVDCPEGHIRGSLQVPPAGVVARTKEVIGLLAAYCIVIFKCILSMHRGSQGAQIFKKVAYGTRTPAVCCYP